MLNLVKTLPLILILLMSVTTAVAESDQDFPASVTVVRDSDRLFIDRRSFVVQVHEEYFVGLVPDNQNMLWDRTVKEVRIIDRAGTTHFAESYDIPLYGTGFEYSYRIEPYLLMTEDDRGILLVRDALPSAPSSGRSIRIFSRDEEKIKPISHWLTVAGDIEGISPSDDGRVRLPPGDTVTFLVWTGHFSVVVPVLVDLEGVRILVPEGIRSYALKAKGPVFFRNPDPVNLFMEPSESSPTIKIAVSRSSRIEYIETLTEAHLAGEKNLELRVLNPWLRVRVDGQEGWLREERDFISVGLPPAG
jgi:hypothetical protein